MRKEIVTILLLIIITIALVYSVQTKMGERADVEKQTLDLQNQLSYYENLTNTLRNSTNELQNSVNELQNSANELQNSTNELQNLMNTLPTQVSDLQAQLHDLQNPIYNVTIENMTQDSWWVPVGVTMAKEIQFTVKNTGVRDVGGLTIVCEIQDNGTVGDKKVYGIDFRFPDQLGILHTQESVVMGVDIMSSLNVSFAGKDFVVKVMLDNATLDERALPLQAGYSG